MSWQISRSGSHHPSFRRCRALSSEFLSFNYSESVTFYICHLSSIYREHTLRGTGLRGKGLVRQHGKLLLIPKVPGKAHLKFPIKDETTGWTLNSVRCGAIGRKVGMTQEWDNYGIVRPLTLIRVSLSSSRCHTLLILRWWTDRRLQCHKSSSKRDRWSGCHPIRNNRGQIKTLVAITNRRIRLYWRRPKT